MNLSRMIAILFVLLMLLGCQAAFGDGPDDDFDPDADARARAVALLARCYDDVPLFNSAILKREPLWWRQEEIARSVCEYRDTVVYSGNAIGKDYLVGTLVPWWLSTRFDSLMIVTGPSQTLLGSVTFKEVRRAVDKSRFPLGATMSKGIKSSPQKVELGPGWQALGYSTTSIERASGQHARKLGVIVEEASGLEDEQWAALHALKYTWLLAIGNPVRAEGEFVRMIRQAAKDKTDGIAPRKAVNAIHVPSTDSPHADWEESPFGLADKTWIDAETRRYGAGSLWVNSHIHAIIPTISFDTLIPASWLHWSFSDGCRPVVPLTHPRRRKRRISCDLGEGVGRDSSAVWVADWLQVLDFRGGNAMGLPEAAFTIAELRKKWNVTDENISYDGCGIGKDFANNLAQHGITGAVKYLGDGTPRSTDFTNLRTEAAWNTRTRLNIDWAPDPSRPLIKQDPFWIPDGPWRERLEKELKALTYELVGMQTKLITKKKLMDVLGHSPDFGDGFTQLFAF